MSFYKPRHYKFTSEFYPSSSKIKKKLLSFLVIASIIISTFMLISPIANVSAQPDGFEYFVHGETNIQKVDEDMDGYFETARIYYDVDTTTAYAEIKVVLEVYDDTTDKLVKELSESYTIFYTTEFKDTFFEFRTAYTGVFNFTLSVFDINHNKKEYGGNDYPIGNTTLEINPNKYDLIVDATAYDADADGYNDDVRIKVMDTLNFTLNNVSIYIDGEYRGITNESGMFLIFNTPRGIHEVDAFYHSLHGNTDFKSEGTGQQNIIYVDADPFDDDQDGYLDDVLIRAYAYNYYVLPNADVFIDWVYYGTTNQQGLLYAYNFEVGFHDVFISFQNFQTTTTFYAEGLNVTDLEEYFFSVDANVIALDGDGLANDLDIYLDVDVSDGKSSNVTVNATVFYENRTVAAKGSTNYTAVGYEVEDEHIYIHNLTNNLTYNLRLDLFDENNNLEDVWYIDNIVIQVAFGVINVDMAVQDLNDDNHLNDVLFRAHIKNEPYHQANIKVHFKSNNSLVGNVTTSLRNGFAFIENLYYTNYTWKAYDNSNQEIDNGSFELYDRNPLRTVQVRVRQFDSDFDNFFDDFEVLAFDERDLRDNNVTVKIISVETQQIVKQGFTSTISSEGFGRFLVEDLQEGFYTYTASIQFGIIIPEFHLLRTGWFYSYGNSTEATSNLNAFAIAFDADSDGYKNDVQVRVTDRNNQPVMNTLVYYDGDIQNANTTNMNGITIGKDFTFGWHDVDVVFLGNSPTVPRGAQAFTRFFSEGIDYDEYFFYVDYRTMNLDDDNQWNDFEFRIDTDVNEDVTVEVSIEVEIYYSTNDTLFAQEIIQFEITGSDFEWNYFYIYNLTYNEDFHANLTLKDKHGNIEDYWNKSKILVIPITPVVNINVFLDQYNDQGVTTNFLSFYAHILEKGVENITIGIYHLSNDTKVVEVITNINGDARVNQQLEDGDYYYIATNNSNHTIEYGEINIGDQPASIMEFLTDGDNDNFFDDFRYTGKYFNVTPFGINQEHINITISIYDFQDKLLDSGNTDTEWHFYSYNYTEGYYKYIATYESQRVTNGTFYSYGNGFVNSPPIVEIAKPVNSSSWLTKDTISFDGTGSYDPDPEDIITFYWTSNISGPLGYTETFDKKLPEGVHRITLFVDDGRGSGHNVSKFVTITVTKPIINETNSLPIADAGSDQNNVPVNSTVVLDGSGSSDADGHITEYNWTFVSGPSTPTLDDYSIEKPTFFADKIGTYEWKLGVMDNKSAWSATEDSVLIKVITNRAPVANISSPLYLDIFNTTDIVFFESNGTYDPDDDFNNNGMIDGSEEDNLTYKWTLYRGNESVLEIEGKNKQVFNTSSLNSGTFIFEPGTHFINLTVLDDLGSNASFQVEFNTTNVPPVANITSPEEDEMFRKFKPIQLDGRDSIDGDNITGDLYFYWTIEKSGMETIIFYNKTAPTIQEGLDEGDYTITLWVDDNVSSDLFSRDHNVSTIVNITVENRAPIARADMDNANKINKGELAYFNGSRSLDPDGIRDEENFTYYWDLDEDVDEDNDGNKTNDEDLEGMAVNYTFPIGKMYVVTLTVDDGSDLNNTGVDNLTITINNLPEVDPGNDITDAKVGEEILLDASDSYDPDKDPLKFLWIYDEDNPNINSGWSSSPFDNVTYTKPGDYTVILNVSDGTGYVIETKKITVIKPNSPPTAYAGLDIKDIKIGETVTFSGINCTDPDKEDTITYTWDFGDETPTTQGINVTHQYIEAGVYTVTLEITDGEAEANDTLTVTVRPMAPTIDFPQDGGIAEDTITIYGTTNSEDITSVELKFGNSPSWRTATPESDDDWSSWSYKWDTTKENNGEIKISVRSKTSYATSLMKTISVNVTNEPDAPELKVTISFPSPSQTVKDTITIRGTCIGANIDRVEIKIGTGSWILADDTSSGDWSSWEYRWDTTEVNDNQNYRITVQVTDSDSKTDSDDVTVRVRNQVDTSDGDGGTDQGLLESIGTQNLIIAGVVILIILLLLVFLAIRSRRKRRRRQKEEFMRTKEEPERRVEDEFDLETAVLPPTKLEEKRVIKKQPVRCPKCKEYSVIEDDGERPLMIECVHCGVKGFISEKTKVLSEPQLPGKEEDEEKVIIQCPKCSEMFTVDDEAGEIVCPSCGVRGNLNQETIDQLKKEQKEFTEQLQMEPAKLQPSLRTKSYSAPPTPPSKESKRIRCPNCESKFTIKADADSIECPHCGATGSL